MKILEYSESLEVAVLEDARRLDDRANELSTVREDRANHPNAERVAQLRGFAAHLRAMSAVRQRVAWFGK